MFNSFFNSSIGEIILAVIIGVVQGIAEFLPISSTAHLLLASKILTNQDIGLSASNVIQFGTLIAIIHYFRVDLKLIWNNLIINLTNTRQLKRFFKVNQNWIKGNYINNESEIKEKDKYDIILGQLAVATIPIIFFALLLRKQAEVIRGEIKNIAIFLILGGFLIGFSEIWYRYKSRKNEKKIEENLTDNSKLFTLSQVLTIGFFQCLAIFPGMSRSGSTLAGALITGRKRNESVRFSFLLSIPALALSSIFDIIKVFSELITGKTPLLPITNVNNSSIQISVLSMFVGFVVAWIVGEITLRWLLKYLGNNDSRYFILYRLVAAIAIFLLL